MSNAGVQSHSITLARALKCVPIDIAGATEAFAVEGSPADSVMLALNSPVFQVCCGIVALITGQHRLHVAGREAEGQTEMSQQILMLLMSLSRT